VGSEEGLKIGNLSSDSVKLMNKINMASFSFQNQILPSSQTPRGRDFFPSTILVKPKTCLFFYTTKVRPTLIIGHGEQSYQTSFGTGKNNVYHWNDIISFICIESDRIGIECLDATAGVMKGAPLGHSIVQLQQLLEEPGVGVIERTLNLMNEGKKVGELTMEIELLENVFRKVVRV